jgi:hypothetical protein
MYEKKDNKSAAIRKGLHLQKIISLVILISGLLLVTFMITYEDEPGALPLMLILIGGIWFTLNQIRIKKNKLNP